MLSKLIEVARYYQTHAYVPYSHYPVGAALLADDGKIYGGCNVENASYGGTLCAERVAMSKAISEGATSLEEMVIVGAEDFTYPCGICRQFLIEFSKNAQIHLVRSDGSIRTHRIEEILPHAFTAEDLR